VSASTPILGGWVPTAALAVAAAVAATAAVHRLSVVRAGDSPRTLAGRVGAVVAAFSLGLWAVVQAVADPASFSPVDGAFVLWVALAGVCTAVLTGGTTYAYARFRYRAALLSLFAVTAFAWYAFLLVGDGALLLSIWSFVYAPVFAAATLVLLAAEWLLRRYVDGENGGNGAAA